MGQVFCTFRQGRPKGEDLKAVPRFGTLKRTVLAVSLGKLNNKQKHTISLSLFIGLLMTIVRSRAQVVITKFNKVISFSCAFK